ncbi:MAG TPA: tRNA glutamyl-Q(34) synthetase GluQRS [Gammaproteobacteria bacterium]|nr:tRNA glutamyl-Q(34) synthetase GluQRS [Gammaproteobacteria bacterium]
MGYVGRFAPSPTGPLHLGSLATAVASYLHARRARGQWLVRIEDIDPPREVPGAADDILRTLEAFELEWDGEVVFQSTRLAVYRDVALSLLAAGLAFRCRCSRSEIRAGNDGQPGRYPGTCRERRLPAGDAAIRVCVEPGTLTLADELQGPSETDLAATTGDYVVMRRDELPAYHLAVVVDDAEERVTNVVRGVDLLDSTPVHCHLQRALKLPTPQYCHLPVVVHAHGQKLSKQTGAAAVTGREPGLAAELLRWLGVGVPNELTRERPRVLWEWAIERWDPAHLRGIRAIPKI